MNRPSYDDYEESDSQFAKKASAKTASKLRTRKNVFNRPFGANSTQAPTYVEAVATRRSIGHADSTELIEHRSSELDAAPIEYLDEEYEYEEEEEEVVEKRPARSTASKTKKKTKLQKNLLTKVGWSVIGLLVLRLICMDRGVWDYFATENSIKNKKQELSEIHKENIDLKGEIARIQVDKNFQRQLAKEHLGVIAADEFLILFAGENNDVPSDDPTMI